MKFLSSLLLVVLILFIPCICILAAPNVSLRAPDFYKYEFNRSEVTSEISLSVTDDTLATFFSDYMIGKLDDFQLTAEYRGRERPVFGFGEVTVMSRMRSALNYSLYICAAMFLCAIAIYIILLKMGKKETLRLAYKCALVLYVALAIAIYIASSMPEVRAALFEMLSPYVFTTDDILPLILPVEFMRLNIFAGTVISALILLLGLSVTWRVSKPERMFS